MTEEFIWVCSDNELAEAAQAWQSASVLAIDTEFVRTETFYANLGLVQICLEDRIWLIDPLKIENWQPLAAVLVDTNIVKVLHALSEDAEVLLHSVGVVMENVFDTQIAAGFLGYPVQVSYAKLVESLFEVSLPKEATRSDWLQRPLDSVQCQYAAADVHWLYKVYQIFSERLQQAGRYDWIKEDTARVVQSSLPIEPEHYYFKLRGAWKLKGERLQTLKDLCIWREQLARSSNVNRGRILQDRDLITIAEKMPSSKSVLQKVLKIPSRKIRFYGDQIIHMVREAQETRRQDWPERIDGPLPADQAELFAKVRKTVTELSEQHDIPAELLARKKVLEAWLRSGSRDGNYQLPEAVQGWRKAIIFEAINSLLMAQWKEIHES